LCERDLREHLGRDQLQLHAGIFGCGEHGRCGRDRGERERVGVGDFGADGGGVVVERFRVGLWLWFRFRFRVWVWWWGDWWDVSAVAGWWGVSGVFGFGWLWVSVAG
jgi:hypothetical protein